MYVFVETIKEILSNISVEEVERFIFCLCASKFLHLSYKRITEWERESVKRLRNTNNNANMCWNESKTMAEIEKCRLRKAKRIRRGKIKWK